MKGEAPRPDPELVLGIMFLVIAWGLVELLDGVFSLFGISIF